jgi:hypothetical protein
VSLSNTYDSTLSVSITGDEVPSTATFTAHVRYKTEDETILATLTTADGGIEWISSVVDGDDYKTTVALNFDGDVTSAWTDSVITDLVRTDSGANEYMGFKIRLKFETPVTRLS